MKKLYAIILGFTAILLAAAAAYFSVFGLSKLFIGASLSVIIMAGTLEFSKVIVVSFLHQFWKKLAGGLKAYLLIGTIILMLITSIGIYGFLSNAYSKVSIDLDKMNGQIELLDKKIEIKEDEKVRLNEQIETKNERIVSLTNLRKNQETRLDSMYQRGWIYYAGSTEDIISKADEEIEELSVEIKEINNKIGVVNDSIASYEIKKLDISNGDVAGEVGPLKYISKLTGTDMDTVVNWLIIMLIIVFDPLAVALIVATSTMLKLIKKNKKEKEKKEGSKEIVELDKTEKPDKSDSENDTSEDVGKSLTYVSDKSGEFVVESDEKNKELGVLVDAIRGFAEEKELEKEIEEEEFKKELAKEHEDKFFDLVCEENEYEAEIIDIEEDVEENIDIDKEEQIEVSNEEFQEEYWQQIKEDEEPWIQEDVDVNFTNEAVIDEKVKKQSLYLSLLNVLYENGKKSVGDEIPPYIVFEKNIRQTVGDISTKEIKDFLVVCNLFKITEFSGTQGIFEKSYDDAKYLISRI